jgi:endonuclease/exonuclease/phosphatase (EEP) superfamily protein YafD
VFNAKKIKKPLFVSVAILYLLSSVRFLGNADYWLVDILSNFPFQYALASLILMFFCFWKRTVSLAVLAGILFIFNMLAIIDLQKSIEAAENADTIFTVYSVNINKNNGDLANLKREILEIDPEIVLLLEVTPSHEELLRSLKEKYSYRIQNVFKGALGFVFLSQFPIQNYHITELSDYGNSLLEAALKINTRSVLFYGIHARRPDRGDFNERKMQFVNPARRINEKAMPAIVAGDFNATPYSQVFRDFVRISGLKDSREGFGWQPSWPTYFPPLWIPIDHILVTPDITIHNRTTGSYIGSDHYPVIANLSLG